MIRNSFKTLAVALLLSLGMIGGANAERSASVVLWDITLPNADGSDRLVRFTFIENGMHIYQQCQPFSAIWGQGDRVQISVTKSRLLCAAIPLHETMTMEFFAHLKIYYPSGDGGIILMTIDNELIEATRVAPTPKEGQIIWN